MASHEETRWAAVDAYLAEMFVPPDPALNATLNASDRAGLPTIGVTPLQGKLLMLLASACHAVRILEIGTLGGYSTIWLARALPDGGQLITIEHERRHFETAVENIANAGLSDRVEVRFGSALEVLAELAANAVDPFDLIFIDADKRRYAEFFTAALPLTRRHSLIIADNVVRKGDVADRLNTDENVAGIRRFFDAVRREPCVNASVIQTVGGKGYDGWAVMVVTSDPPASGA